MIDELRRAQTSERLGKELLLEESAGADAGGSVSGEMADDELQMLFVCCDEELSEQQRLVLALKLLCGFGVAEIAQRLFLTEANVLKIVTRGKTSLAERRAATPNGRGATRLFASLGASASGYFDATDRRRRNCDEGHLTLPRRSCFVQLRRLHFRCEQRTSENSFR